MTAKQFEAALSELGWSHEKAADELGVAGRGRVTDWANGYRPVPAYIAVSVRTRLELKECQGRLASATERLSRSHDDLSPYTPGGAETDG